jgi:hypothetical protein
MSNEAPVGSGIPQSGTASGNADAADQAGKLAALVNETVNKALGPRLARLEEKFAETLRQALAASQPELKEGDSNGASSERVTNKALHAELETIKRQLQQEKLSAEDARQRSEVYSKLASKMGADHPVLGTLMDSLYDVRKRFTKQSDGRLGVKFSENGYEDIKSLDEGVEALFKGELKHLVQASKANQLPTSGNRIPIPQGQGNGSTGPIASRLLQEQAVQAMLALDNK